MLATDNVPRCQERRASSRAHWVQAGSGRATVATLRHGNPGHATPARLPGSSGHKGWSRLGRTSSRRCPFGLCQSLIERARINGGNRAQDGNNGHDCKPSSQPSNLFAHGKSRHPSFSIRLQDTSASLNPRGIGQTAQRTGRWTSSLLPAGTRAMRPGLMATFRFIMPKSRAAPSSSSNR